MNAVDKTFQYNAVGSWRALGFDVLICGDEAGVAELCSKFGALHQPEIERANSGMPLLSAVLRAARNHKKSQSFIYVNSDIVLTSDAVSALRNVASYNQPALACTRRFTLPLRTKLDFEDDWQARLSTSGSGAYDPAYAIDLFFFVNWVPSDIPDLVVGRAGWDNWMIQQALNEDIPIIDMSPDFTVFHPVHAYNANRFADYGIANKNRRSEDHTASNRELVGHVSASLDDASFLLINGQPISKQETNLEPRFAFDAKQTISSFQDAIKNPEAYLDLNTFGRNTSLLQAIMLASAAAHAQLFLPTSLDINNIPALGTQELDAILAGDADILQAWVLYGHIAAAHSAQSEGRQIYVWGAGNAGVKLALCLQRQGVKIFAFIETEPSKSAIEIAGRSIPIVSGKRAVYNHKNMPNCIFIASTFWADIKANLDKAELIEGVDYLT